MKIPRDPHSGSAAISEKLMGEVASPPAQARVNLALTLTCI